MCINGGLQLLIVWFITINKEKEETITVLYHKLKNKRKYIEEKKCCSHYIRQKKKAQLCFIIFLLFLIKIIAIKSL